MFNLPSLNQVEALFNPDSNIPDWLLQLIKIVEPYNESLANDLRLLYKFVVTNPELPELENWFNTIQDMRQHLVDIVPYTSDISYIPKTRLDLALNIFWTLLKLHANSSTILTFARYLYNVKTYSTINAFTCVATRERSTGIESLLNENRTDVAYTTKSKLIKLPEHMSISRPALTDTYSFSLQPEFVYRHTRTYETDLLLFSVPVIENREVKTYYCYFDSTDFIVSGIPGHSLDIADQTDRYTQYVIPVSCEGLILETKTQETIYLPAEYPIADYYLKTNVDSSYLISPRTINLNTLNVLYKTEKGQIIPERFGDTLEIDKVTRIATTETIYVPNINELIFALLYDNTETITVPLLSAVALLYGLGTYSVIKASGQSNYTVDSTRHTVLVKIPSKNKVVAENFDVSDPFSIFRYKTLKVKVNSLALKYGTLFHTKTKQLSVTDGTINRQITIRNIDGQIYFVIPDMIVAGDSKVIRIPYATVIDTYLRPTHYLLYTVGQKISRYVEVRKQLTLTETYVTTTDFVQMRSIYSDLIKKYNDYDNSCTSMLIKLSYTGTFLFVVILPQNYSCDDVFCEVSIGDLTYHCNVEYLGSEMLDKHTVHVYKCTTDLIHLIVSRRNKRSQKNVFATVDLIDDIHVDISVNITVGDDKLVLLESYKVGSLYNNIELAEFTTTNDGIILTTYGKVVDISELPLPVIDNLLNDCEQQQINKVTDTDLLNAVNTIVQTAPNQLLSLYDNTLFDLLMRKCIPPFGLQIEERKERQDTVYLAKYDFYIKV